MLNQKRSRSEPLKPTLKSKSDDRDLSQRAGYSPATESLLCECILCAEQASRRKKSTPRVKKCEYAQIGMSLLYSPIHLLGEFMLVLFAQRQHEYRLTHTAEKTIIQSFKF